MSTVPLSSSSYVFLLLTALQCLMPRVHLACRRQRMTWSDSSDPFQTLEAIDATSPALQSRFSQAAGR